MTRLVDRYCRLLEMLLFAALAAMVVMVFGNVVLRYAFNSGITVSEELSRWFFVWMTFLGAIVGLEEHAHLGTDILVRRLGAPARRACFFIGQALMLFATLVFLRGSWQQTVINLETEAPVTGAPMAVVYAAGVVFAASATVLLARELWRGVTGRLGERDFVTVQESEERGPSDEEMAALQRQAAGETTPTAGPAAPTQGKQP